MSFYTHRRQKRFSAVLEDRRLESFIVTHLPNVRYLCDFTGSNAVLAVTDGLQRLFTDGRYTQQARAEVKGAKIVIVNGPLLAAAAEWLKSRKAGNVGIESERMTVAARAALRRALPAKIKIKDTAGLIEQARMVKDEDEIEQLRAAVKLGSSLFETAVGAIRPGVTEAEVAAELEYAARRAGAEQMSFETIVAAGPRSALPHGRASSAAIPAHGFVVLDFGVILAGYCSDMTRTVCVGSPNEEARRIYHAVREAQQAALEAIAPGVPVAEVDREARSVLKKQRLDRYFTHSTGHGVGLEIHEPPRLGRGQTEVLRAGMVVTVEPGVYIPGKGGVRIEDMVVVTEQGHEILTPTPKDLIAV